MIRECRTFVTPQRGILLHLRRQIEGLIGRKQDTFDQLDEGNSADACHDGGFGSDAWSQDRFPRAFVPASAHPDIGG